MSCASSVMKKKNTKKSVQTLLKKILLQSQFPFISETTFLCQFLSY